MPIPNHLNSGEVLPGDICILKTGDTVPADLRIFEAMNLNCDEKSLTGEAEPVEKIPDGGIKIPGTENVASTEEEVGVGDRFNMAYSTTTVTKYVYSGRDGSMSMEC